MSALTAGTGLGMSAPPAGALSWAPCPGPVARISAGVSAGSVTGAGSVTSALTEHSASPDVLRAVVVTELGCGVKPAWKVFIWLVL